MKLKIEQISIRSGKDIDASIEILGNKIKSSGFDNLSEMAESQNAMITLLCEHFFELATMNANKEGKKLYEMFSNVDEMADKFATFATGFMDSFAKIGALSIHDNWELFKKQRTERGIVDKNDA